MVSWATLLRLCPFPPQLPCVWKATYIRTMSVATFLATVNCIHPLGADAGNGKAKPRKSTHLLPRLTSHLRTKSLLPPVSLSSQRLAPTWRLCFLPCLSIPRSLYCKFLQLLSTILCRCPPPVNQTVLRTPIWVCQHVLHRLWTDTSFWQRPTPECFAWCLELVLWFNDSLLPPALHP